MIPWPYRGLLAAELAIHGDLRGLVSHEVGGWVCGCLTVLSAGLDVLARQVVLFRIGTLVFVTFGLFAAMGALLALAGAGSVLIGQGVSPERFLSFALGGSVAVVGGSWIAGQILDYRLLLRDTWTAVRRPVFVSWGGLLGMMIAPAVFSYCSAIPILLLLDALARTVPLGHALGRLGCLSYGCCFGRPTQGPLSITYRNPAAKAVRVAGLWGVRLHPAALYEAVLDIGILITVNVAVMLQVPLGVPAAMTLLMYGAGRFGIEFLRNNDGRFVAGRLSLNHLVSVALALAGVVGLPVLLISGQPSPPVVWDAVLAAAPRWLPAIIPSALIVFFGFAMHRRQVGEW